MKAGINGAMGIVPSVTRCGLPGSSGVPLCASPGVADAAKAMASTAAAQNPSPPADACPREAPLLPRRANTVCSSLFDHTSENVLLLPMSRGEATHQESRTAVERAGEGLPECEHDDLPHGFGPR